MSKLQGCALLLSSPCGVVDDTAGGVVGSLRSSIVNRLEGQCEELEVLLGDLPLIERQADGMLEKRM